MKATIERILVAADGSQESENAFGAVMPLVRAYRPEVAVLHVLEDPDASFSPPANVAKACRALRKSGVNAHLEIREGRAAEEIARLAAKADLLVMSTHGRGGWEGVVLGSVTQEVIRRVEVPILVTRPGMAAAEWTRMLVALDGSPRGERILDDVIPLAERLHIKVELLQAAMPPITPGGLGEIPGVRIEENPLPYLDAVRARLASRGIDVSTRVAEGRAGTQILAEAARGGASLICMTTHGRTGLPRILMGSIADEVLRHAPCPVLLRRSVGSGSGVLGCPPG